MLTLKWRELLAAGVTLTAVVRPMDEVVASSIAAGLLVSPNAMAVLDAIYIQLAELPIDVPKYRFDQLAPEICAEIFQRCAGYECPKGRAEHWCAQIIEPDIREIMNAADAERMTQFYNTKGF